MENRNMLLAFALSLVVLLGWSFVFPEPKSEVTKPKDVANNTKVATEAKANPEKAPELRPVDMDVTSIEQTPHEASDKLKKFYISNDLMHVGMDERGWLTDAELLAYRETKKPDSDYVHVLHTGKGHNVYVNVGMLGHKRVTPFQHVSSSSKGDVQKQVFQAKLDNGKLWQRSLSLTRGSYVLHVEDRVLKGDGIKMFRQVVERNPDKKKDTFYEHMGPTGFLNGELQKPSYDDLDDEAVKLAAIGGWTGMMNRYFITAIINPKEQDYRYYYKGDGRSYQAGVIDDGVVNQGDTVFVSDVYIGPKYIPILKSLGVGLERSVDFGWFAFIAKPMHTFMMWMYQYVQNFGWCIILLVITIKIIFFYPTQKAYTSMANMRKIQPEMTRLRELYGDDRQKMGQEMMKLYKKKNVNPMGGCLPILIQIPVFFSLYKVLLISIEMRQAPFIGWIQDLSAQDPYFILPVLMGISMFIQQKLNPKPADPMQAKIMQFLPPVFTIMFLFFPSGLVLYWVVNNTLTITQQWFVMKKLNAI
jgi:YidC/Oxa1 family membrane protein insertase